MIKREAGRGVFRRQQKDKERYVNGYLEDINIFIAERTGRSLRYEETRRDSILRINK